MVLAVDRTKKLNPIWLFLWHSYHEELCKIADLRYKNTNFHFFLQLPDKRLGIMPTNH